MKLISMTDFVLGTESNLDKHNPICLGDDIQKRYLNIVKYANFLKQPLTLGMFTTCDEDGNVLEEPTNYETWERLHKSDGSTIGFKDHEQYQQSKERVLFEGFVIENIFGNKAICYDDYGNYIYIYEFPSLRIEHLIKCDLTLTESALKKIGI